MLFMLMSMLMLLMLLLMFFVDADVEDGDVDVDVLFVDAHYVCSSVAGSLCSAHKARYPRNCGITAPL